MAKNLLKVPRSILQRLATFDQDDVVAATVKLVLPEDIGRYRHLGLALAEDNLCLPDPQPPSPSAGRYSDANLYGMEKVRKDLPKVTKSYGFWAPSWGSGSFHYVSHDREVFIREIYPPKQVNLSIALVERRGEGFLLRFAIDQVISRRTPNFEQELLYNLNLLQENVGAADVFESVTSLADYALSVKVDWQLLPPGTVDEVVAAMLRDKRPVSAQEEAVMKERVTVMHRLQPEAYITGTDGFLRYFGANSAMISWLSRTRATAMRSTSCTKGGKRSAKRVGSNCWQAIAAAMIVSNIGLAGSINCARACKLTAQEGGGKIDCSDIRASSECLMDQ